MKDLAGFICWMSLLDNLMGTGKTYVSFLISQHYKQVILLSSLKQFAKQNLDRFVEYEYSRETLLVDSDGERDIKEITKFLSTNKLFVISATPRVY